MAYTKNPQKYLLDDGAEITAPELSKIIGGTKTCARSRLDSSTDPEFIFRPLKKGTRRYESRVYKISDGREVTVRELAEEFDIAEQTMYWRLGKGQRDIEKLSKPSGKKLSAVKSKKSIAKTVQSRNFYDPLSRLLLKTI